MVAQDTPSDIARLTQQTTQHLLPLRTLIVELECVRATTLPVLHHVALYSFAKRLCNQPDNWSDVIRLDAPESGRITYPVKFRYRFHVIGLAGSDNILNTLIAALQKLPQRGATDFQKNWKLYGLFDGLTDTPVQHGNELTALDSEQLSNEAARWQHVPEVKIEFFSPAKLYKRKTANERKRSGGKDYCRDAADMDAGLLFSRLQDAMLKAKPHAKNDASNSPTESPAVTRQEPPPAHMTDCHVFWLDSSYKKHRKEVVPIGGLCGWMHLSLPKGLSVSWWQLLLLGQYTGIGKGTAFGWGRYRLEADVRPPLVRVHPAQTMLHWVANTENLTAAWSHVASGADRSSVVAVQQEEDTDEGTPEIYDSHVDDDMTNQHGDDLQTRLPLERLQSTVQALFDRTYKTPELTGYLMTKANGGVRALAVPPFQDRVMQRAVSQILTPALDQLMEDRSYGYRPGRSRMNARDDIEAAWRAGYRWVFESDIRDFFDTVQLDRLEDRLRALLGEDPVVDAVINWMRAPVRFEGQLIERNNGLPQGSPLSPLMANLMLDDFDSDMKQAGFRLVRYADDFVVLCKSQEQAQQAADAARQSLNEHGFELHPDKTAITPMSDGFRYLGYLFVNQLSVDVGGKKASKAQPADKTPPVAWLRSLDKQPQLGARAESIDEIWKRLENKAGSLKIGERNRSGELIIITGLPAVVCTDNKRLKVVRKDKTLHLVPWRDVQNVLLFGNHQVTTQAAHAAMLAGVTVHMANGYGRYRGALIPGKPSQGHRLWLAQLGRFTDQSARLYCAKQVITSRVRHCREMLRQKNYEGNLASFDGTLSAIERVDNLQSLRGLEGNAAREYFSGISQLLEGKLEFSGRNRRPPTDPFNVLLSLGYSFLFGYCDSITRTTGLLPWEGFFHRSEGTHAALISDLMEPFRHIIERSAITAVLRGQITPSDFELTSGRACKMSDEARRKYMALLVNRMQISTRARGQEKSYKITEHIRLQSLSLKQFIVHGEPFVSWRML